MKITITIETGNEAMQTWGDIGKSLRSVLASFTTEDNIPLEHEEIHLRDNNGNIVGRISVEKDDNLLSDDDICTLCKEEKR